MPRLRTRPFNRKIKNISRSTSEVNNGVDSKNEFSVELGINKTEQRYFRKKRRSVSRYAIIMLRHILQEKQMYKLLFDDISDSGGEDEDVYLKFLEMIGGFEARKRIMNNSPFSTRPKSKEETLNKDFPELTSLLTSLPNHRFSSHLKSELLSLSENSSAEVTFRRISESGMKNIHRSDTVIDIEEYPAFTLKSKSEEDIADVTAGIDLLAIPKSMSSMAESMYS